MDEFLTMEEIKARNAPDNVLIADPQWDEMQRLCRGRVVIHSSDRAECWHKVRELNLDLDRVAVEFLGEYPEVMVLNLWGDGLLAFIEELDMDETLTMEEIKARYAPYWVLIAEPETDDQLEVVRGKVVGHGPNSDDLYRKAMELKLDDIAVRYLGELPEHMVLGL